ncbi:sugar-binding transcriptional regulator [Demetria terragena]|uniref:sugar-binding transcriptional regulator n=1 Tax=Demetria terragena TaxID=63959 RepID=UPI000380D853|nr:sugar-binding domain-containing protein [Demetria terragena]
MSESHRHLLATVARRYYLEDRSKVQIAHELSMSRFKVARLLVEARESGVVRIEVDPPTGVDADLSDTIRERLNLRRVIVVDSAEQTTAARRAAVAAAAADVLGGCLGADDILGLPSSRTVAAVVGVLPGLPPIEVVQLTGALRTGSDHDSSLDLVREAALLGGGTAHQFYAPFVASDAEAARILRDQPDAKDTAGRVADVTVAVVGIGAWKPDDSSLFDTATSAEHRELRRAGAIGEIAGIFLDANGIPVQAAVAERLITLRPHELRAIPHVIGIPFGPERAAIVRAAAAGGFIDTLICDGALARAVIETLDLEVSDPSHHPPSPR